MTESSIKSKSKTVFSVKLAELDRQISELEKVVDSEDSSDDESKKEMLLKLKNTRQIEVNDILKVEKDSKGNIVRLMSSVFDNDRIDPLPGEMLPSIHCTKRMAVSGKDSKPKKSLVRFRDEKDDKDEDVRERKKSAPPLTIREYKDTYKPASLSKTPNWCRICKWTGKDVDEFEEHQNSKLHLANIEIERKASSCQICRKQFTSPEQLKQHLVGRAHRERTDEFIAQQRRMKS